LGLIIAGTASVASSSFFLSTHIYGISGYYLKKQFIFLGLASIVGVISYMMPTRLWQSIAPFILLGVIALLSLVLVSGIGRHINGSSRWLNIVGINIQASEVAKLGFIIYLSSYVHRKQDLLHSTFMGFITPLLVMMVICGLLIMEPDFGSVFIVCLIGGSMLFLAGLPWGVITFLTITITSIMAALVLVSPYRLLRFTTFFDPWAQAFSDGYQLTQSLIAVGRGGITGVGLGYGLQKQLYLPEAHTDFIYAVMAEEFGLLGACVIILVFVLLAIRFSYWIHIAIKRNLCFEAMCLYGIMIWWTSSAMFSMAVNLGLVPTKGIAFPFFSYGGSNLLVNACATGIVLRITKNLSKGMM
jgi:cell division protein FtsW